MLDSESEKNLRISTEPIYEAFRFEVPQQDFIKALLNLYDNDPEKYAVLYDVADHIVFIDYLRFEIGWKLEDIST